MNRQNKKGGGPNNPGYTFDFNSSPICSQREVIPQDSCKPVIFPYPRPSPQQSGGNSIYTYIHDPTTGNRISIMSLEGKQLLKKYIKLSLKR
tara:strand:- start:4167 stop:4442 length:276 start_codon:yes stop_codon:yes gene_type:complete